MTTEETESKPKKVYQHTASARNRERAKRDVLVAMKPNLVYTVTSLYIDFDHRWGKYSIRRALNELVEEKTVRTWTIQNMPYYELSVSKRVAF